MSELINDENLCLFFNALNNVQRRYVVYSLIGRTNEEEKKHCERVFAYELYRRWANLLNDINDNEYILNGEISKDLSKFDSSIIEEKDKYPDLVLHKGQNRDDGNKIVCEIKKASNTSLAELKKDLYKLDVFTKGGHAYNLGILLIYGYISRGREKTTFDLSKFKENYESICSEYINNKKILIVYLEYGEDHNAKPEIRYNLLRYLLNNNNYETLTFNHSLCAMFAGGACPVSGLHLS